MNFLIAGGAGFYGSQRQWLNSLMGGIENNCSGDLPGATRSCGIWSPDNVVALSCL